MLSLPKPETDSMTDSFVDILTTDADRHPLTVSELTSNIKSVLEDGFSSVWVEGEVVNFVAAASGHWYFSLNDGTAQIRCVSWKGTNYRIRFKPTNGITVRIRGKVSFYTARGETQLVVESLEPSGEGALRAAYEQIRSKLESEGLFAEDLKRKIPFFPGRVGVVTSRSGAAFHDIFSVLTRRARSVSILLIPANVQGEGAADSIRNAITSVNSFNKTLPAHERLDVLIVGRGGGSSEDLWAFNDEALARAIRDSSIPIISAVGHEIDWTISDMVADIRAATPSAAAEMVAGKEEDILSTLRAVENSCFTFAANRLSNTDSRLNSFDETLFAVIRNRLQSERHNFSSAANGISSAKLEKAVSELNRKVDLFSNRTFFAADSTLKKCDESFKLQVAKLDSLSPLSVLTRGYSIVQTLDGAIIRNASDVAIGDRLIVKPGQGRLTAEVVEVEKQ
jgi:exodeoxyribonuclease VII large subunit